MVTINKLMKKLKRTGLFSQDPRDPWPLSQIYNITKNIFREYDIRPVTLSDEASARNLSSRSGMLHYLRNPANKHYQSDLMDFDLELMLA